MIEYLTLAAAILFGIIGLVWGADRFIDGAASTARHLGMSIFMVGLTIVSLGTSAPEILVAITAALSDAGEIAIGNALGSNLANVGMVMAITAIVSPVIIKPGLIKLELPVLFLVTAAAGYTLLDLHLSRLEGVLLLASVIPVLWIISRGHNVAEDAAEFDLLPKNKSFVLLVVGLSVLLVSSKLLVWGASGLATLAGVSPLLIGMTIIAVGTSLPELAASVSGVLRGHHDIALGNVIGSNIFNIMTVMSIPAIIQPLDLPVEVLHRDFMATGVITLAFMLLLIIPFLNKGTRKTHYINRTGGTFLLGLYCCYYLLILYPSS